MRMPHRGASLWQRQPAFPGRSEIFYLRFWAGLDLAATIAEKTCLQIIMGGNNVAFARARIVCRYRHHPWRVR
jgi:hypothetical protein